MSVHIFFNKDLFTDKNTNESTVSLASDALFLVTVFPAFENTLSLGVDDAGQQRRSLATIEMNGKFMAFNFHHDIGQLLGEILLSFINLSTSLMDVNEDVEDASGASSSSSSLEVSRRLPVLEPNVCLLAGGSLVSLSSSLYFTSLR
jgi:hypothetical protein